MAYMVQVENDGWCEEDNYVDDFDNWDEVLDDLLEFDIDEELSDDPDDMTFPFVFVDGDSEITIYEV